MARPVPAETLRVARWRSYARMGAFVRPYAGRLVLVLFVSLAATMLGLVQPYLSKLMIDDALLKTDMRALVTIAAAMFVVTVLGFALNMLASYRYLQLSAAMLFDMRIALLRHLQTLSPRFYGSFRLGDLISRINGDVGEVQRVTADSLLAILSNVLFLIGCIVLMLLLNWRLFLVSVVLIPGCIGGFAYYQRRLTALTRELRERGADIGSMLVDTVLGMRAVVALGGQRSEAERFAKRNGAFVRAMLRMQRASFMAGALPGTILTIATSGVILYGGWMILHRQMTIGSLVAFMAYHMRLLGPIQALMGLTSGLASARVSLARIVELFDMPPDVREADHPIPFGPVTEAIRFEHVAMRYDRETVLNDIDLTIPAGVFCAILGPSGIGKSTIADLIVRQLDPVDGRVLVDGNDLRAVSLTDLRREIILVEQSPHLFNDSIRANIAFGLDDIDHDAVLTAAEGAGLAPVLARLPLGLDTAVGERGQALSVGERHRVALARVLLRRPSVLILDEPTAALDEETERLLAASIRAALPAVTLIVITHRPALAAAADMIVALEAGHATVTQRA